MKNYSKENCTEINYCKFCTVLFKKVHCTWKSSKFSNLKLCQAPPTEGAKFDRLFGINELFKTTDKKANKRVSQNV